MHLKAALLILVYTILLLGPSAFEPLLDRASDLDGNSTQILFIKDSLIKHHTFPQWNPYIHQGIPVSADPLHGAFHPFVLPAFMLFSPETAVKILYFISIYLAGLGMYVLLHRSKVLPELSIITACIYMSCGYVSSHMVAGHFEKILSFGILPWFVMCLYEVYKRSNTRNETMTAMCMALILFSGNVYNSLYAVIVTLVVGAFGKSKRVFYSSIRIVMYFVLLGAIKLIPLIELQHYIGKVKEPFAGSQNLISILYYFFIPFKPVFRVLGVGSYLETGFAWWEKVAFIGPFTLIGVVMFFLYRKRIFQAQSLFFMMIGTTLILLSMPAAPLNPYHLLISYIPALQLFHVPSRAFGLLTIIFLILSSLGFQSWYAKRNGIHRAVIVGLLLCNLISTYFFFMYVFRVKQMPIIHSESATQLVSNIKRRDKGVYYIAQYLQEKPLQQHTLISMEQKILNSNYGLQLKGSPAEAFTLYDFSIKTTYSDIHPAYIVGGRNIRMPVGTHSHAIMRKNDVVLYESQSADPYASLKKSGKSIDTVTIRPNRISMTVTSAINDQLILLESSYPGWHVYENGKQIQLTSGKFVQAPVKKGTHMYDFVFKSQTFLAGLGISCIAWVVAIRSLLKKWNSLHA